MKIDDNFIRKFKTFISKKSVIDSEVKDYRNKLILKNMSEFSNEEVQEMNRLELKIDRVKIFPTYSILTGIILMIISIIMLLSRDTIIFLILFLLGIIAIFVAIISLKRSTMLILKIVSIGGK